MDDRTTRLECLKLAVQHYPDREPAQVVARAAEFEKFIAGAQPEADTPKRETLTLRGKTDNPSHKGR